MTVQDDRVAEYAEEHRLLQLCRAGDPDAYAALFDKHWPTSVGYARRLAGRGVDPEELAQEAFTRVVEAITHGKGPTISMGHYLRTTIRTVAAGRARSNAAREVPTDAEALSALFEAEAFHDDQSMSEWLVDGFNRLTERQQFVVWEHTVERRSVRSIAPDLGVSSVTALRAYHQAMTMLREGFVQSTAEASNDPECARFVSALASGEDTSEALEQHLLGCQRCQSVHRRLEARSELLMSTVLVAGLGKLGILASKRTVGSAVAGWLTRLTAPMKVTLAAVPVIASALGGIVLVHGDSTALPAEPTPSVDIVLGASQGGPALVALGDCQVVRDPVSHTREIWRLAGGDDCGMHIEALGLASSSGPATLLDTRSTPSRLALEITQPGRYTVVVRGGAGRETATKTLEIEVRL